MSPYLIPVESLAGMWELICFMGTVLTSLLVWLVQPR
jgi:hypothetical protein